MWGTQLFWQGEKKQPQILRLLTALVAQDDKLFVGERAIESLTPLTPLVATS
jgi:hypothetical protein